MSDLSNLPTGREGDGDAFAALDLERARAMIEQSQQEAPQVDVDQVVAQLEAAAADYRADANRRKFLVSALDGLGAVLGIARALS